MKLRWNLSNKKLHLLLSIAGLTGAGVSALFLLEHWYWLALTGVFTFIYSAPMINHPFAVGLRKIAVGKTIYLAFAWTHVTVILPLILSESGFSPVHVWYTINRFFFIYAICIVFDRRDRESDQKAGIKSLVTWLHEKGIDRLFWLVQLAVLLTSVLLLRFLPVIAVMSLFLPALLLSLLYQKSKQSRSDYLYYFLLDGLMALSAPILILLRFAR